MGQIICFRLNGIDTEVLVNGDDTLLEVLRNNLKVTSPKCGCNHGDCGACTVHIDGKAAKSCTVLAATINGRSVDTLESLSSKTGELHPLQKAFIEYNAPQCGYCTPGMLMAISAYLDNISFKPTELDIREALGGNLCRCTGYKSYVDAILAVVNGDFGSLEERRI